MFVSRTLQYIDKNGKESFFTIDTAPENLYKKKTLLEYFRNYMAEHLLKVGDLNAHGLMGMLRFQGSAHIDCPIQK